MSRSVTIPGPGISSSITSAAPVPFSIIIVAASRSVWAGPTVRTTSTSLPVPAFAASLRGIASSCRSPQAYPTAPDEPLLGGPGHIDSGALRADGHAPEPNPRNLALPHSGPLPCSLGLRHHQRRHDPWPGPLHQELRRLPHARRGRDLGADRPQPRRCFCRRPRGRRAPTRSRASSRPRSRTPVRATTTPRSRCRPTSSPGRTSTTSPPTSAAGPACPARRRRSPRRPRSAGLRRQRLWRLPHAGRRRIGRDRAQPRRSPARANRGRDRKSIVDPNADIAKGFPANVMPAEFGNDHPRRNEDLVEYLITSTAKRQGGSR